MSYLRSIEEEESLVDIGDHSVENQIIAAGPVVSEYFKVRVYGHLPKTRSEY